MLPLRDGAKVVPSASLGAAGLIALVVAAGCSTSPSAGAPDAAADARHGPSLSADCPLASQVAACQPAPASACSDPALSCAPDALPAGLACTGVAQCSMAVDPCPGWPRYAGSERTDTYVCTCSSGRWRCVDCYEGASLCVESPDGSLYFGGGADGGPDAGGDADADAGTDADASTEADSDTDADAGADGGTDADASVDANAGADAGANADAAADASPDSDASPAD